MRQLIPKYSHLDGMCMYLSVLPASSHMFTSPMGKWNKSVKASTSVFLFHWSCVPHRTHRTRHGTSPKLPATDRGEIRNSENACTLGGTHGTHTHTHTTVRPSTSCPSDDRQSSARYHPRTTEGVLPAAIPYPNNKRKLVTLSHFEYIFEQPAQIIHCQTECGTVPPPVLSQDLFGKLV